MTGTENDEKKYFKSLLLLIGKNKIISDDEKALLLDTCDILGFNRDLCKDKIEHVYDDNYIIDEAPRFSNPTIAKILLKDGIRIALADKSPHIYEIYWLRSIAKKNHIPDDWLAGEIYLFLNSYDSGNSYDLEIQKYLARKHNLLNS